MSRIDIVQEHNTFFCTRYSNSANGLCVGFCKCERSLAHFSKYYEICCSIKFTRWLTHKVSDEGVAFLTQIQTRMTWPKTSVKHSFISLVPEPNFECFRNNQQKLQQTNRNWTTSSSKLAVSEFLEAEASMVLILENGLNVGIADIACSSKVPS